MEQQPLLLAPQERRWLDERKTLRIGIAVADYEPIDITTDGNRYQGISADYLSLVANKLGIPTRVSGFAKREQAVAALLAGDIDVLTNAVGYERGFKRLAFTHAYMPDRAVVVGRGGDASLPASLEGKRIVVLDGYADAQTLHRVYPRSAIVLAPTLYSALEALVQGDVDVYIGNEVTVRAYIALRPYLKLQVKFESLLPSAGVAFALRDDNTLLRTLFDRALSQLDASTHRRIQERWTKGVGPDVEVQRIRLNAAERLWIRKRPLVTVASSAHPPYIYKDEQGQWTGLNVDVLARISRMTGLVFVHEEMPSTSATLEALEAGRAQMNTTLAQTPERRAFLDFSYAYGGNNWVYVVRADESSPLTLAQMSGKRLALPERHALLDYIAKTYPDVQLMLVPTYADARRLVELGQAQATIQNEAGAWNTPSATLKVGRSVEGLWSPDRFAVVKEAPELLSIVNKALDEFPVAEMRAIRMQWLGTMMPVPALWQRLPVWAFWLAATLIMAGGASCLWRRRMRAQVHQQRNVEAERDDHLAFRITLLNGVPDPVYVYDLQGRLQACNASYEASLGISFEQLNGRRLIDVDLIPRQSARQMHALCMTLIRTPEPVHREDTLVLVDRQIEAAQWLVPLYGGDGELRGVLGGWRDVTEHRRTERELEAIRGALETARS